MVNQQRAEYGEATQDKQPERAGTDRTALCPSNTPAP